MRHALARWAALGAALALAWSAGAAPAAPPGFHVHLVREVDGRRFWRGGAPRRDTLEALAADARQRRVPVTLVDLRHPATADDRSRRGGRLPPREEAALAARLGIHYVAISALDRRLLPVLQDALRRGDVYLHCMYGVNRTGFAVARYAAATGEPIDRRGLGQRDWRQGLAFQRRLQAQRAGAKKSHRRAAEGIDSARPPR